MTGSEGGCTLSDVEDWEQGLSRAQREMLAWTPSGARGVVGRASSTLRGQVLWDGKPVIDDDDGGTAGVREPRRPRSSPPALSAALDVPEYAYS